MLYADTQRLRLANGEELQAFVRTTPHNKQRLLLVHGNPATLLDWENVVARLPKAIDLAAIDLPGFGRSPRGSETPESVSLERLAEYGVATAEALGWTEPFFVVGHSHGGGVAQMMAANYPKRIAGIVLLGSLSPRQHPSYRLLSLPFVATAMRLAGVMLRSRLLRPLSRAILRGVMKTMWSPAPVPSDRLDRDLALLASRTEILTTMVHVAQGYPCRALARAASRIRCPVLVVHGEQDALVPANCARSTHELIVTSGGQCELTLLPGAGHALPELQCTEVANLVSLFLARNTSHFSVIHPS